MKLTIETNFPGVQAQVSLLQKEIADRATARALNRTVALAKTAMSKEIRSEFVLDAAYVRDRLRIKRASFKAGRVFLQAALDAQEKPRSANLIRFNAVQTGKGVTVKIKRRGARKLLPGAFIANKGRTVFERVPGTRMASRPKSNKHGERIRPLQTIDVAQMFTTRRINAAVVAVMQSRFPAIFEREVAYALSQFSR